MVCAKPLTGKRASDAAPSTTTGFPGLHLTGQWIESVTDWAIRITDWGLFPDWVSSHARLADPIRPMPNKGKSGHSGLPIALISRLPDWVVQSVLPIAIHRLLHRLYPLASSSFVAAHHLLSVFGQTQSAKPANGAH